MVASTIALPNVKKMFIPDEGYTIIDADLKKADLQIVAWEAGDEHPTLGQLEKLARLYKRSIATLMLPEPPEDPSPPTDFRHLPAGNQRSLTARERQVLREARLLQARAKNLLEVVA